MLIAHNSARHQVVTDVLVRSVTYMSGLDSAGMAEPENFIRRPRASVPVRFAQKNQMLGQKPSLPIRLHPLKSDTRLWVGTGVERLGGRNGRNE